MKPSKEQFLDYVRIQRSGVINMFDVRYVCEESYTGLTKDIVLYIFNHYSELIEEYKHEDE